MPGFRSVATIAPPSGRAAASRRVTTPVPAAISSTRAGGGAATRSRQVDRHRARRSGARGTRRRAAESSRRRPCRCREGSWRRYLGNGLHSAGRLSRGRRTGAGPAAPARPAPARISQAPPRRGTSPGARWHRSRPAAPVGLDRVLRLLQAEPALFAHQADRLDLVALAERSRHREGQAAIATIEGRGRAGSPARCRSIASFASFRPRPVAVRRRLIASTVCPCSRAASTSAGKGASEGRGGDGVTVGLPDGRSNARRFARAAASSSAWKCGGGIDRGSRQESRQDVAAPAAEHGVVDPGVLGADLRFVLREALLRGAEDRRGRCRPAASRRAVSGSAACRVAITRSCTRVAAASGDAGGEQLVHGPGGAPRLVVVAAHVVDGIVEPERELDLAGRLGEVAHRLEMGEAFGEMLQRVIAPLRLAVGVGEALTQRLVAAARADVAPGAPPRSLQHGLGPVMAPRAGRAPPVPDSPAASPPASGFTITRTVLTLRPMAMPSRRRTSTKPADSQNRSARSLPAITPRRSQAAPPAIAQRSRRPSRACASPLPRAGESTMNRPMCQTPAASRSLTTFIIATSAPSRSTRPRTHLRVNDQPAGRLPLDLLARLVNAGDLAVDGEEVIRVGVEEALQARHLVGADLDRRSRRRGSARRGGTRRRCDTTSPKPTFSVRSRAKRA